MHLQGFEKKKNHVSIHTGASFQHELEAVFKGK
jgi:hypothetical protein